MKKLYTLKSKKGSAYKVYIKISNDRYWRFFIKWRKWFLFIPYYSFICTDYVQSQNNPIEFRTNLEVMKFIDMIEENILK
jgi:hypothetical protein